MLKHRTRRPVVSPCPSHARPARVRSQVCAVWRWRIEHSCWLSTRPPRGPRCRCGCDAPSNESWTAQLHARTRQRPPATWVASGWAAQISSNPPPDGRAWEDGWPVSAIPKLAIRSGRGLGVSPHASSRACSRPRGEGALCALPAWISVARPAAPLLHRAMAVIAPSPLSSLGSSLPLTSICHPVWVCTTTPSHPPLPHLVDHHPF